MNHKQWNYVNIIFEAGILTNRFDKNVCIIITSTKRTRGSAPYKIVKFTCSRFKLRALEIFPCATMLHYERRRKTFCLRKSIFLQCSKKHSMEQKHISPWDTEAELEPNLCCSHVHGTNILLHLVFSHVLLSPTFAPQLSFLFRHTLKNISAQSFAAYTI